MPLPSNFSSSPDIDPHSYFYNICIEFKKVLRQSKDIDELQAEMDKFINASKQMKWKHNKQEIYRKDDGEKAANKVWNEFKRYISGLQNNENVNSQDLLDAIAEVERLINNLRVT